MLLDLCRWKWGKLVSILDYEWVPIWDTEDAYAVDTTQLWDCRKHRCACTGSDDQKVAEKEEKAGPSEVLAATDNKETVKTLADSQAVPPMYNGIPVYYQIPVTDSAGRVIQHLPVERTERKSNGGIAALFARLSFKKKSRITNSMMSRTVW